MNSSDFHLSSTQSHFPLPRFQHMQEPDAAHTRLSSDLRRAAKKSPQIEHGANISRPAFIREHWPILFYGWLMSLGSGFGQTYFVSVFGGAIRSDLNLDHTAYGACYSAGTLLGGCVLIWAGRLIDRVSLPLFSMVAVGGLAFATLSLSFAQNVLGLALAFLLLRFFGQGLMSHAAITTMARNFSAERGRAVAFSLSGHVAGGTLFPVVCAAMLTVVHWRDMWLLGSAFLAILVAPLVLALLSRSRRQSASSSAQPVRSSEPGPRAGGGRLLAKEALRGTERDWTPGKALRDPRLFVALAVLLAPSFITTGLIFHQVHIGAQKGWGVTVIASALSVFAIGSFVSTLIAGRLVDRFTATALVPFALVPMIAGCALSYWLNSSAGALIFFGLLGLGSGTTMVLMGAFWPEIYGTRHLGAIRAFAASGSVLSSGLAPGLFGALLDWNWSAEAIAMLCALYCILASVIAALSVGTARNVEQPRPSSE